MTEERNAIPLIITGICSILGTVGALWYYGYLHFAKPEDALLLNEFTMLKTVPGEDYKVSLDPAPQVAQCIDGVLVLFDTEQKGLTGVLINAQKKPCAAWARKPRRNSSHKAKDRSLRQLLHWNTIPVGAAEGCDLLILKSPA